MPLKINLFSSDVESNTLKCIEVQLEILLLVVLLIHVLLLFVFMCQILSRARCFLPVVVIVVAVWWH